MSRAADQAADFVRGLLRRELQLRDDPEDAARLTELVHVAPSSEEPLTP